MSRQSERTSLSFRRNSGRRSVQGRVESTENSWIDVDEPAFVAAPLDERVYVDIDNDGSSGDSMVLAESAYDAGEEDDDVGDREEEEEEDDGVGSVFPFGLESPPPQLDWSYEGAASGAVPAAFGRETVADIDLGTSLPSLAAKSRNRRGARAGSGPAPDRTARRTPSGRLDMSTVRLVAEPDLERQAGYVSSSSTATGSGSSTRATRATPRRKKRTTSHSSGSGSSGSPDMSTLALATAGISIVAGLSFGAGYAIGRRSAALRVVS